MLTLMKRNHGHFKREIFSGVLLVRNISFVSLLFVHVHSFHPCSKHQSCLQDLVAPAQVDMQLT